MTSRRLPCGLRETDRIAYMEGALKGARGEYVDAHINHCPACQTWLVDYDKIGRLLQDGLKAPEEPWRRAAFTERLVEELRRGASPRRRRFRIYLGALGGILLVLLLTLLPFAAQGGQFLDGAVQFGKVQMKQILPLDQQRNVLDTLNFTQHKGLKPQVSPVAPLDLPAGLTLTEHKVADDGHIELLYKDGDQTILWIQEYAPRPDLIRTEMSAHDRIVTADGVQVLVVGDPRPGDVSAFIWVHNGVFYNVLVLAAPHGNDGGFKLSAALEVVRAFNTAR